MKYSNPQTKSGRDSYQGSLSVGSSPKSARPHTQSHGPMPSHMASGSHTYRDAVVAVHKQTGGRIAAPGLKAGTQATLQVGSPIPTPKSQANKSDRVVSTAAAIKRSVSIKGKKGG